MENWTIEKINALASGRDPMISVIYCGETANKWNYDDKKNAPLVDAWRVRIGGQWAKSPPVYFEYFTGKGLRIKGKPKQPSPADILYSLILDSEALDYDFFEWCDNFGLSRDSIKAMNIYHACLESGRKLREKFNREEIESIREALNDY